MIIKGGNSIHIVYILLILNKEDVYYVYTIFHHVPEETFFQDSYILNGFISLTLHAQ